MSVQPQAVPAPERNPETAPYWEAATRGELLLRYCNNCDRFHYFPRSICPLCFSDRTEWRPAAGRGTIYSFTVMRVAPQPFVLAFVTLDEGVSMMTNIVDCTPEALHIGDAVQLTFREAEDGTKVPMFTPA